MIPATLNELDPCRFRDESKQKDVEVPCHCCGSTSTALVEVGFCDFHGKSCTIDGAEVNGERTKKCRGCKSFAPKT